MYFAVLDTAMQSLEEGFTQLRDVSSVFGVLYNVHDLQKATSKQIIERCRKIESALTHGDSKDIHASDLCDELLAIARRVPSNSSPKDLLHFIYANSLSDSVPFVRVSLRILLTLPVSVASDERTFSKLKLIKTRIRSSMTQDRLCSPLNMKLHSA